jgi:hypothetical protein
MAVKKADKDDQGRVKGDRGRNTDKDADGEAHGKLLRLSFQADKLVVKGFQFLLYDS